MTEQRGTVGNDLRPTFYLPFNARERGTFYVAGKPYHWGRRLADDGRVCLSGPDPRTTDIERLNR